MPRPFSGSLSETAAKRRPAPFGGTPPSIFHPAAPPNTTMKGNFQKTPQEEYSRISFDLRSFAQDFPNSGAAVI